MRLPVYRRFVPGSVAPELPKMVSSSRNATLATLRCLSKIPVHGTTGALGDATGDGEHPQPACYHAPSRVQATHYTSYLQRKVSSAVSSLTRLARKWEGPGPGRAHPGQLSGAPHQSDGGQAVTTICRPCGPPPEAAAAASGGQGACRAVTIRKRSASEASLDEPPPSGPQACPPTSSLQQRTSPATDDYCDTPSGPADPASQTECGWSGAGESTGVLLPSACDAERIDRSSNPPTSSGATSARPTGLVPCPSPELSAFPRQGLPAGRSQQHHLGALAARAAPAPRSSGRPGPSSDACLPSGRPGPSSGYGGPQRSAQHSARGAGGGLPAYGGVLAPTQLHDRADTLVPNAGPHMQRGQPGLPRRAVAADAPAYDSVPARTGGPPRRTPPSLCDLPSASCTLQQLISRRGLDGRGLSDLFKKPPALDGEQQRPGLTLMAPPPPQQQQRQRRQFDETASVQMHGGGTISSILECGSPRLRAAIEATAAATTAHWHQRLAALPPMAAVYKRWPLSSLVAQLASSSGDACDAGFRRSCGGGGSNAAAGLGQARCGAGQLLRHVQTPLPRRDAVAQLDVAPQQGAQGPPRLDAALPLAALSEPLPADTCQGRNELWDLFLLNLPFITGADCSRADVDIMPTSALGPGNSGPSMGVGHTLRMGDGSSRCACCCDSGGGGQGGEEEALLEQHDEVGAESGQDDSDVYISSEGLACLASLVSAPTPACGGWRLPFLVRQRLLSGAAAGCGRCHGTLGEQGHRQLTLYFAEPLRDSPGLLLDSWSRLCGSALAARGSDSAGGRGPVRRSAAAAAAADGAGCSGVQSEYAEAEEMVMEEEEDCACCQQDEWQLGGLSLLVLSHCNFGQHISSCSGPRVAPVHVVALAGAPGLTGGAARQAAIQATAAAAALQYPMLACRAELLSSSASTLAMVVDPADGTLLAQQCLDGAALERLATERSAQGHCWQLAHALLTELRRLPPGPYMLCMDADAQLLELRGVERGD